MLSRSEKHYLEICIESSSSKESASQLSDRLNTPVRTIERALKWGRDSGFFTGAAADKCEYHIAELKAHIKFLESELKLARKHSYIKDKKGNKHRVPIDHKYISVYSRELRETRSMLAELEGIYKKTLNLEVTGKDGKDLLPTEITINFVDGNG